MPANRLHPVMIDEAAKNTAGSNTPTHLKMGLGILEQTATGILKEARVGSQDIALPAHMTTWGIRTTSRVYGMTKSELKSCGDRHTCQSWLTV